MRAIDSPPQLKTDPVAALNCGIENTKDAAVYLFNTYPLAFLDDQELGLKTNGQSYSYMYRESQAGRMQPITKEAFILAYLLCSQNKSVGDQDDLSKFIEGRFKYAHDKRQEQIDLERPKEAFEFLTPENELPTFREMLGQEIRRRYDTCVAFYANNTYKKGECLCERDNLENWVSARLDSDPTGPQLENIERSLYRRWIEDILSKAPREGCR
jgi:hypothetical protein